MTEVIMSKHEEIKKVFDALKHYGEKYNADYYCVILTPNEGQKLRIPGSFQHPSTSRGEYGVIIEGVVEKEVLYKS